MANGIPLRPGLIPSYAQRLGLLAQPGVTVGDITGRSVQPGLPARAGAVATSVGQPVMRGSQPPTLMRRAAPLPPMPLATGAMRQAQRSPMAPAAPAAQPGFLERIAGIDPTSAAGQALGAAAATGLQLSGYRTTPLTTAEGLGAMMAAGQKAFREQKAAELGQAAAERAEQLELLKLAKPSDFERKLRLAGIDSTTPEGQKQIRDILQKPQTVFMGSDKQKEIAFESAMATRKELTKEVQAQSQLASRLAAAVRLLETGAQTGRITKATLPLRQIAREIGLLGEEEVKNLSDQEVLSSVTSFAAPNMRVVGSGSSSDKDVELFQDSTLSLSRTPEANLMIGRMQLQFLNYNRDRLRLLDKYIEKFGSDLNFPEYADEKLGRVFQRVSSDEELTAMIEDGKIKEGNVFYNNLTGEFVTLTKDMM